jgi:hypothetical protein
MTTGTFARSVVGAFGLLVAFASSSYAQLVLYHGSLCNPEQGSANRVEYNQFGVHNTASPTAFVNCGGAIDGDSTITIRFILSFPVLFLLIKVQQIQE